MADLNAIPETMSAMGQLQAQLERLAIATEKVVDMEERRAEATEKASEADRISGQEKAAKKQTIDGFKQVGSSLLSFATTLQRSTQSAIKFAGDIGTTATRGVQLELDNRRAQLSQLRGVNRDQIVTIEQARQAQKTLTDTFIGVREGMQISAEGTLAFGQALKGGFGANFELTNESLRALITTGMATEAQFESFRKASGRAGLSSSQFATIVNKNALSFMLYGEKFAKAAIDAERMGINLASIQSAQESLVTNLDGTIDTIAQLNQLGAGIDFGTFVRIAETEGPQALLAYVRATVPANLMQSASIRSLFSQFGISVEDFMKGQEKQTSAADQIEQSMTKAGKETSKFANTLTDASVRLQILSDVIGEFIPAIKQLFSGLYDMVVGGLVKGGMALLLGGVGASLMRFGGALSMGLLPVLKLGGLAAGMAGLYYGSKMVSEGNAGGFLLGAGSGAIIGAQLGSIVPGVGTLAGGILGAVGGTALTAMGASAIKEREKNIAAEQARMERMFSDMGTYSTAFPSISTYQNTVSSGGASGLNSYTTLAGNDMNKFVSTTDGRYDSETNSNLIRKIDQLITTLESAGTTITVGGTTQTVPRMRLTSVRTTRNE